MAKVIFYMKSSRSKSTRSIVMRVSIKAKIIRDGKRIYKPIAIYTGITLPPNQWDNGRAAIKSDKKRKIEACPAGYEINRILDSAHDIAYRLSVIGERDGLSSEEMKDILLADKELSAVLGRKPKEQANVFDWIENYLWDKNIKDSSRAQQLASLNRMREFDQISGYCTTWAKMDYNYYSEYVRFLRSSGVKENTIGKYVKDLNVFLRAAQQSKIEVPNDFAIGLFKRPSEKVDSVYLTEDELSKIASIDYSDNDRLDNTRRWFLIGCNTGLRVSDLMALSLDNIDGENIVKRTQKTGADVVIPMTKQLKELIKDGFPRPITGQRYNNYIKEVCRDAGISKWQKVSSHTARRSFATNMYQRGIPAANLMLITGHTTESSFYKYIRTGLEENADQLREKFPEIFEK